MDESALILMNPEIIKTFRETLSHAIGPVSKWIDGEIKVKNTIKQAKADAQALIITTNAEIEAKTQAYNAFERLTYREVRRQKNIEKITRHALEVVATTTNEMPQQKIDEDWIAHFYNSCQDISNEQMQILWAKILAEEFTRPNSYSLRTLNIVKLLSPKDAEIFSDFGAFVFCLGRGRHGYLHTQKTNDLLEKSGIPYDQVLRLKTIGLLHEGLTLGIQYSKSENSESEFRDYQFHGTNYRLTIDFLDKSRLQISAYPLTETGNELFHITNPEPNLEYVKLLQSTLSSNFKLEEVT